jgi:hypothetical protein
MTLVPEHLLGAFSHFRSISYLFPNHGWRAADRYRTWIRPAAVGPARVMVECGSAQ